MEAARFRPQPARPGDVEYALLLVLVSIVVIVILLTMGNQIRNVFSDVVCSLGRTAESLTRYSGRRHLHCTCRAVSYHTTICTGVACPHQPCRSIRLGDATHGKARKRIRDA